MSFLPEDDLEFLKNKAIRYECKTEKLPDNNERRGVLFPEYTFEGNLREQAGDQLIGRTACDLLILIPSGYATTKLDCFYTRPFLKRPDGTPPNAAAGESELFGQKWQLWSRHLADNEWRVDIDGLETFLQYVRAELRKA